MPRPAKYLDHVVEALSVKFNNLVYEKQAKGEDVIVLSLGEAFFDIPLFTFEDLPMPASYHYSHSRGVMELRRQLCEYYGSEYHVPVNPATEMLITAGSKIAIHMALMTILDVGDEVLIHEPAWVSYAEQVKLCHGVPVTIPYDRSVYDFASYITPKTRAIIVNNPNNPRGSILTRAELEHLHKLAAEHDVFLISDEAYSDFLLDAEDFISCAVLDHEKKHTIVCNSMSKNYGMSGWRIGYVIANPIMINEMLKTNQHLITCPATILEFYLSKHFDEILATTKPQIAAVVQRRLELARFMASRGISYLPGEGTFYFFVSLGDSTLTSSEFCERLLREYSVSVVPGIGYGESCDRFVRVSVGTESEERTRRGIERLGELIKATSPAGVLQAGGRAVD